MPSRKPSMASTRPRSSIGGDRPQVRLRICAASLPSRFSGFGKSTSWRRCCYRASSSRDPLIRSSTLARSKRWRGDRMRRRLPPSARPSVMSSAIFETGSRRRPPLLRRPSRGCLLFPCRRSSQSSLSLSTRRLNPAGFSHWGLSTGANRSENDAALASRAAASEDEIKV